MSAESPAQRAQKSISDRFEREAVGLLYRAGWSIGELKLTFQCSEGAVRRVLEEELIE